MKTILLPLTLLILGGGGLAGFEYWRYVTKGDDPYDEIGISLNQSMPGPIRDWGCGKLKVRFGQGLPPLGCASAADPAVWR